jgi:hypothetical protein
VSFELVVAGVTAISDADLTKYKQAIAATIDNVDASQVEITMKSARLRRLADSVVLEVTIRSPTAEIANLVENALTATSFASALSTNLDTLDITASPTIDTATISKTILITSPTPSPPKSVVEGGGGGGAGIGAGADVALLLAAAAAFMYYRKTRKNKDAKAKVYSEPPGGAKPVHADDAQPTTTSVQPIVPVADEDSKEEEFIPVISEEEPQVPNVLAGPIADAFDNEDLDDDDDLDDLEGLNILGPPAAFGEEWMDEDTPPGTPDDA